MRTTFLLSTSMAHIFNTKQALMSYSENARDVLTLDGVQRSEGSGTARFSTGQYLVELPNAYYVQTAEENEVSIPLLLMDGARANRRDEVWEICYKHSVWSLQRSILSFMCDLWLQQSPMIHASCGLPMLTRTVTVICQLARRCC